MRSKKMKISANFFIFISIVLGSTSQTNGNPPENEPVRKSLSSLDDDIELAEENNFTLENTFKNSSPSSSKFGVEENAKSAEEEEDNNTSSCGTWNEEMEAKVNTCSFWMEGILLIITGSIGLIGNILSVIVLSKPGMHNSFNQLLIFLSVTDSIFIILAIWDYSMVRAFKWSSQIFNYLFPFIIYPLNNISFCASIFTTVAMAFERYIAVCRPLHYRDLTTRYTVLRRTLSYVIPVLVFSAVLNLPKFLESRFAWVTNPKTNETIVRIAATPLRNDPEYIRYYINWGRLVTTGLIPIVALIFFNWNIFRGIQMTHERTRKRNKQKASEMNLAAILMCIVFLFFVCHFPRILLNVHEFFMLEDMIQCREFAPPSWFYCITSFNHWLLIVNASCNLFIYCSVGTHFKAAIVSVLPSSCCKKFLLKEEKEEENGGGGGSPPNINTNSLHTTAHTTTVISVTATPRKNTVVAGNGNTTIIEVNGSVPLEPELEKYGSIIQENNKLIIGEQLKEGIKNSQMAMAESADKRKSELIKASETAESALTLNGSSGIIMNPEFGETEKMCEFHTNNKNGKIRTENDTERKVEETKLNGNENEKLIV